MNDSIITAKKAGTPAEVSPAWPRARRFLLTLALVATFVGAFYTVENWRGRRAWDRYRRDAELKGRTFDWQSLIPPPVPDDQNIFKAPMMTEWFVRDSLASKGPGMHPFSVSPPTTGPHPALAEIIETDPGAGRIPAANFLRAADSGTTNLDLLRKALERPYARMEGEYRPFGKPLPDFVQIRIVAQLLAQRADAELLLGQSENAWHDLSLIRGLCRLLDSGRDGKPMTLVAGMIEVAVTGIYIQVVHDGLRLRAWREPELTEIQKQLSDVQLPRVLAAAFDCERVAASEMIENSTPSERLKLFGSRPGVWDRLTHPDTLLLEFAPRGWLYQNRLAGDRLNQLMTGAIDTTNGIVRPRKVESAMAAAVKSFSRFAPYTFIAKRATPNFIRATQTTVEKQLLVNEAIIACGLERYRSAHNNYPETLDQLSPQFVQNLPHDAVNGEALRYRRTTNGGYVLYSVGWNEKDDGGKAGKTIEDEDWVWETAGGGQS